MPERLPTPSPGPALVDTHFGGGRLSIDALVSEVGGFDTVSVRAHRKTEGGRCQSAQNDWPKICPHWCMADGFAGPLSIDARAVFFIC